MNEPYLYSEFIKPSWAPPSSIFGPVWTVLYAIIAVSFGTVFYKAFKKEIPFYTALPFILNLPFNFLFTPIQFGLKNNILASVDILLVLATLEWALWTIKKHKNLRWVAYANIPYLLWVTFATFLQLTITYLNM
jgi:tryptophan-rich sensory protein